MARLISRNANSTTASARISWASVNPLRAITEIILCPDKQTARYAKPPSRVDNLLCRVGNSRLVGNLVKGDRVSDKIMAYGNGSSEVRSGGTLSTQYLGLALKSPLVVGASPLTRDTSFVRRLENAGVGAIVMHSLFEEDMPREPMDAFAPPAAHDDFPEHCWTRPAQRGHPGTYLETLTHIKNIVAIPVIASLNCRTPDGWVQLARRLADHGADALELNVFLMAMDPNQTGAEMEQQLLETTHRVRDAVTIPLSIKLNPYLSSLPNIVRRLEKIGINGVVLFNRFFQLGPATTIEREMFRTSSPHRADLAMRLDWLAVLSPWTTLSLAITGGVHGSTDVVRAIMAGADVAQMTTSLLENGPDYAQPVLAEIALWLQNHNIASINELRDVANMATIAKPQETVRREYRNAIAAAAMRFTAEHRY